MSTVIEQLESKEGKISNRLHHVQALIDGLDGRPQDFVYEGEWFEDRSGNSKCACGHPIVYNFVVHDMHDSKISRILGSTCIETYSLYRPDDAAKMLEQLNKIFEEIEAKRKAARDAVKREEVKKLIPLYVEAYNNVITFIQRMRDEYKRRGKYCYLDHFFYTFNYNKKICKPNDIEVFLTKYSKLGHQVSYLKKSTELFNQQVAKHTEIFNNTMKVWGN
jgi:hypothetical protein